MSKEKDLFSFLQQHGLSKQVEGEDVEDRHTSFLRVNAPNEKRLIYCKGCGQPIIYLAGDLNNEAKSNTERMMEFHEVCYIKAIEEMNKIRKDVNYKNERRSENSND